MHHGRPIASSVKAVAPGRASVLRCHRPGVALQLMLRHDNGSNYVSGDFQDEIECLGSKLAILVQEPGRRRHERFIEP